MNPGSGLGPSHLRSKLLGCINILFLGLLLGNIPFPSELSKVKFHYVAELEVAEASPNESQPSYDKTCRFCKGKVGNRQMYREAIKMLTPTSV